MITLLLSALLAGADMHDLIKEGNIATLSTVYESTPFGSLVPYALDDKGNPIILISDLAVHTKNLKANSSCSIMVGKVNEENLFNSARITLLGKMEPVPEKELAAIKKLYCAKHERGKKYAKLGDFTFYRMKVEKVYYIGGFGIIDWIELEDYQNGFGK